MRHPAWESLHFNAQAGIGLEFAGAANWQNHCLKSCIQSNYQPAGRGSLHGREAQILAIYRRGIPWVENCFSCSE